jgi:hypothetical protein
MSEIVLSVSENEENLTPANSRVAYFADILEKILLEKLYINCPFSEI